MKRPDRPKFGRLQRCLRSQCAPGSAASEVAPRAPRRHPPAVSTDRARLRAGSARWRARRGRRLAVHSRRETATCSPGRSDLPGRTCRPPPCRKRRPGGAFRSSRIRHQRALPAPWIGQRTNPRPGDVARRPLAWKAPRAHDLLLALRAPEVPPSIAVVAPERRRNVPISGFRTSGWFVSRR